MVIITKQSKVAPYKANYLTKIQVYPIKPSNILSSGAMSHPLNPSALKFHPLNPGEAKLHPLNLSEANSQPLKPSEA